MPGFLHYQLLELAQTQVHPVGDAIQLMVGWHHQLNRRESEQAPGDGEGHDFQKMTLENLAVKHTLFIP